MSVPGPPAVLYHSDRATIEVVLHSAGPSIKHYANADFTSSADASISKKSNVPSSYTLSLVPGKDVTNVNDNRLVPLVSLPVSVSWPEFKRLYAAGPLDPEEVLHQDLTQLWTLPVLPITCYYFLPAQTHCNSMNLPHPPPLLLDEDSFRTYEAIEPIFSAASSSICSSRSPNGPGSSYQYPAALVPLTCASNQCSPPEPSAEISDGLLPNYLDFMCESFSLRPC